MTDQTQTTEISSPSSVPEREHPNLARRAGTWALGAALGLGIAVGLIHASDHEQQQKIPPEGSVVTSDQPGEAPYNGLPLTKDPRDSVVEVPSPDQHQ